MFRLSFAYGVDLVEMAQIYSGSGGLIHRTTSLVLSTYIDCVETIRLKANLITNV